MYLFEQHFKYCKRKSTVMKYAGRVSCLYSKRQKWRESERERERKSEVEERQLQIYLNRYNVMTSTREREMPKQQGVNLETIFLGILFQVLITDHKYK